MERILINKTFTYFWDKPFRVYEHDDVHYFFWPVELGVGKFSIKSLVIPYAPKILDYEPIKVMNYKDEKVVLSRFHYHIITYFNKPTLKDSKPVVDFSFGSHSPLLITDISKGVHHGCDKHFPAGVDSREIDAFAALLGIFDYLLSAEKPFRVAEVMGYDLSAGRVKDNNVFKPEEMFAVFWLGRFPSPEELKFIGYTLLDL